MPKVSVIVPVYGVEKYIGTCIESIISQTFSDFELILIDDGSPDKCGKICDEYTKRDNRVKVFHKQNGGVSSARNLGIENAIGEWLCFVDGDDRIEPTYLEDFNLSDSHELYVQGYVEVLPNGEIIKEHKVEIDEAILSNVLAELEDKNIINSPCFKLYKRNIIEYHQIRFDEKLSLGEDHIFSLTYFLHIKSVGLSDSTGYIVNRGIGSSLTQRVVPLNEMEYYNRIFLQIQSKILNNISDSDHILSKVFNKIYYARLVKTLSDITKRGSRINELKMFKHSFVLNSVKGFEGLRIEETFTICMLYCMPPFMLKIILVLYKKIKVTSLNWMNVHQEN